MKMEDFNAAFSQRVIDVSVLNTNGRRTAAMHLGGVAIECLLKHIISTSLPPGARREWKTDGNDPGHTITNPGHSYQEALNRHNRLRSRIQQFPSVLNWLQDVEHPGGHFIDIRYSGKEPDDDKYRKWVNSYQRLTVWLQKQATNL